MTDLAGLGGWPALLGRLVRGEDLAADAGVVLDAILDGDATPAQVAALLVGLRAKGESPAEIAALVDSLVGHALKVPIDPDGLVDTCGTGGDHHGTVNVSTMAALVVAGAGVGVAKHGNRAASSMCGSADVLEALGVNIDASPDTVASCIDGAGIGFCFARSFHPAMRFVAPVRAELGIPTVFNILGPLANPVGVRRQVVGVSDVALAERMLDVLEARGATRAMVVHGDRGLDELSTTGPSQVWELRDGARSTFEVDPSALGLRRATLDELRGGDAQHNAAVVRSVLAGEQSPARDITVLNAAAALVVAGRCAELADGVAVAHGALDSGAAAECLERFVALSNAA